MISQLSREFDLLLCPVGWLTTATPISEQCFHRTQSDSDTHLRPWCALERLLTEVLNTAREEELPLRPTPFHGLLVLAAHA